MKKILHTYKYEILLFALIQHLFSGLFLTDMAFYTKVVWPVNMLILGVSSSGVFIEKGKWKKNIKTMQNTLCSGSFACINMSSNTKVSLKS